MCAPVPALVAAGPHELDAWIYKAGKLEKIIPSGKLYRKVFEDGNVGTCIRAKEFIAEPELLFAHPGQIIFFSDESLADLSLARTCLISLTDVMIIINHTPTEKKIRNSCLLHTNHIKMFE